MSDKSTERSGKKDKDHKQKVPQLRFPEFNNEWKIIKLDGNAYIKGRIGWKNLKKEEYTDKGPYLIAGKHITEGRINWEECDHITMERYDESPEIALKNDDIIFSKDGSLGNPALIKNLDKKATINGTMMLLRVNNNINPNYMYQILQTDYFHRFLNMLISGSSIPHIFQRDIINLKFPITTYNEQEKIANFLENIDKKIALMEKKYHCLLQFKNNIITNLFCNEDMYKPLLKFNDEKWEYITLNEIGTTYSGLSGKNKDDFGVGTSLFVPYKAIFDSEIIDINLLENIKINDSEKQNLVKMYDILFTSSSETPEEVAMTSIFLNNYDNCYLNSFSFGYRVTAKFINPIFLNYYLRSPMLRKKFYKIAQGSTRYNISKKEIMKLSIKYPSSETQEKIISFILNINNNISNLRREIELNKEFKRSLLSKMFC